MGYVAAVVREGRVPRGYAFILLVCVVWVGGSFLVESLEAAGLSPLLLTYVCNALFVVLLPVYYARRRVLGKTTPETAGGDDAARDGAESRESRFAPRGRGDAGETPLAPKPSRMSNQSRARTRRTITARRCWTCQRGATCVPSTATSRGTLSAKVSTPPPPGDGVGGAARFARGARGSATFAGVHRGGALRVHGARGVGHRAFMVRRAVGVQLLAFVHVGDLQLDTEHAERDIYLRSERVLGERAVQQRARPGDSRVHARKRARDLGGLREGSR